nr:hypothetical protein [uncultured Acetatifactor sp.]
MGEPNNALKVYMNRADRIKSVLEYYLGTKLPPDWKCEETGEFLTVRNSKGKLSFRERDFLGKAQAWGVRFLLGLENQDSINLTYPWRLMELDYLTYRREIERIQERNDCNEVKYGAEDDFKYRYRKDDCLKPVLNLTLYWGRKKWKKPQALKDMMGNMGRLPEKLQRLAGDYPVHMVCMRGIPDEDIQKMDSDLRYVLGIMKRTASPKQYKEYIRKNGAYFSRMPKSAVDVIDACTNIKNITEKLEYTLNAETREEETDMCKALDEIEKNAVKRGLKKGVKQGRKQGERRGALMMLFSLVNDGLLNVGEAARRAKLSKDVFCTKMTKAGYKKPI